MIACADIFGEIHADGRTLILMAQGTTEQCTEADKRLQRFTPLVRDSRKSLGIPGARTMPLTWQAICQCRAEFGEQWRASDRLTAFIADQVTRRGAQPTGLWVQPPPGLVPYSWQIEAASIIRETGGALLWDDPGTGKTVSAILGLIERAAQRFPVLPVVICAPATVVDVWVEHLRRWAPFWRVQAWRGSPQRRRRLLHTADIYVVSYGTARRDAGEADLHASPLLAIRPNAVVADECHKMKDQTTEQSKAVRRLAERAQTFIGLSGTPITHNVGDVWPVLNSLAPLAFPSRERWVKRYTIYSQGDYSVNPEAFNHREPEYRLTVFGQVRRTAKADVLTELPPKVHTVRYVDIPPAWRKAYSGMEADMLAQLPEGGSLEAPGTLVKLGRLRQLASGPCDVRKWVENVWDVELGAMIEKEHVEVTLKAPSWKAQEMIEIMEERPGRPAVAFAEHAQMMRLAGTLAESKGYRVGYIIGGQSMKHRTEQIADFQAGKLDLICVTTGAGGVGITLTRSDLAIFLQRPWSIVDAIQAEDRLHRIGAEGHESIEIIDIVTRNSVESRVREILRERAGAISDYVQDPRIVATILGGAKVIRMDGVNAA